MGGVLSASPGGYSNEGEAGGGGGRGERGAKGVVVVDYYR